MSSDNGSGQSQQYYIRARGKVLGPFGLDRLKTLRARGQFSRVHEVSTDRRSWQPASSVEHLFAPVRADFPEHEERDDFQLSASPQSSPSQPPAVQATWYYCVGGEQHGPVTLMELRSLINQDQLRPSDLVWKDGFADWTPLASVPELQQSPASPGRSAAAAHAPVAGQTFCYACGSALDARAEICPRCGVRQRQFIASSGGKSRTTAAIFALLLGGLGAHHFYLGNVVLGIVYLLFFWTFIPAFVALIEGIIFLTMSDEAFAARYDSR